MRAGKNSLEETRTGKSGVTKGEKRSELENIARRGSERGTEELAEMRRKEIKREKGKGRDKH